MSDSNGAGARTPFQDISNNQNSDPKELKRQRNREYYARNKDDILKRRREARDKKVGSTPMLTDQQNETNTPVPMSRGAINVDTIELQGKMVGEHYSHNVDDAFSGQLQAEQENEKQTPVVHAHWRGPE
ncbi:hypothetical protein D1007_12368 [Hordeum vulgare]|nr:hypothetical protein D1007_12368 [Hordeum vulgare]